MGLGKVSIHFSVSRIDTNKQQHIVLLKYQMYQKLKSTKVFIGIENIAASKLLAT